MPISFESIRAERPDMSADSIRAFLRFADNFECLDSDSFLEAKQKVLLSLADADHELESAADDSERWEIVRRRYPKF